MIEMPDHIKGQHSARSEDEQFCLCGKNYNSFWHQNKENSSFIALGREEGFLVGSQQQYINGSTLPLKSK